VLALRARLVLWREESHSAVQIARWAGVADKTARLWPVGYAESGIDDLRGIRHPGSLEFTMGKFIPGFLP
jgi:hypothetical protein